MSSVCRAWMAEVSSCPELAHGVPATWKQFEQVLWELKCGSISAWSLLRKTSHRHFQLLRDFHSRQRGWRARCCFMRAAYGSSGWSTQCLGLESWPGPGVLFISEHLALCLAYRGHSNIYWTDLNRNMKDFVCRIKKFGLYPVSEYRAANFK